MNFNDSINFSTYTSLRQMMQDPSFNPSDTTTLTFSRQKHIDFPPYQPLCLLKNLKILHLSHNNIEKFTASRLIKGTPLLQELDLSYNKIKNLGDIVRLGELVHLEKLDIRENPVSQSLIRLRLIEFLLFPKKNTSYNGVEVLTATYREGQILKTDENIYKLPMSEDIDDDDEPFDRLIAKPRANKFDHSKTDIRLSLKECPVPRNTNFPRLRVINGEMISIQDVRRILLGDEIEKVLAKEGQEEGRDRSGESVRSTSQKLHEKYVTSYQKKKRREKEAKEDETWVTRQEQFSHEEKILKKEMRKEDSQKIEKRKIIEGKEGKSSESSLQESMESDTHQLENNVSSSDNEDQKEEEKEIGKTFLVGLAATKARSKAKKGSRRDLLQFFGKKVEVQKEEEKVQEKEEVKQNAVENIKPKEDIIRVPTVRLGSSPRRRTVLVKSESKPNFSLPLYSARKENEEQKSINPPPIQQIQGIIKLERVKETKDSEDTTILKDRYNLELSNMENSAVELKTAASKNSTTDINISTIPKAQENTTIHLENNGSSLYTDHMENTKTEDSIVLSNKKKVAPQLRFRAKSGTNLHNFLNKNPQRGSSFLIGRGMTTSRSESRLNNPFISTPLTTDRKFIDNDMTTTETARSKLEESSSCVSHTIAEQPEPFKDFRKTRVEGLRQKERQVFNIKNKLFCRQQKSPSTENSVPDIEKQARSSFSKSFSITTKTPAAKKSFEGVIALKDFYPQTQRAFPFTNAALEFLSSGNGTGIGTGTGTGNGTGIGIGTGAGDGTFNKTAVKLTPVQQSGRQTPGLFQAPPPPVERSPTPDGGNKQRRVLYSSLDGGRSSKIQKKIVIDGPIETLMKGENVKRKDYTIEDLLPSDKDGMPKRVRDQLLIGKGEKYESLKETGELLGEMSLLMNQAKDLRERIHVKKGKDPKKKKKQDESTVKSREVLEFDDVAGYLRDYNNVEVLKLEDHKDFRQLLYLVHNDHAKKRENTAAGDLSARSLESQVYQRSKKEKQEEIVENLSIEGGVQRLKKIPRYMTNVNNKEIERVNRNVQLAAHTMRFREYQGDEATNKYYKEGVKVLRNIQSNMADLETSNKQYIAGKIPAEYSQLIKASLDKFNERNMKKGERDESEEKKRVMTEGENSRRFEYEETKEEKIKNYADTFKKRVKDLKKVKMRVEEYTKNGRKTIDDFLEHEKNELEKIHDKKSTFRDLVELTYTNKL